MKTKYLIRKGKNPQTQIIIRFWDSKKIDQMTKTGLSVLYQNWDKKNERVKNKVTATDKDFINSKLLELKAYILENYNIENNNGEHIGNKWLKNKVDVFFNRVDNSKPELIYFTDWIYKFLETAPKRLNRGKPLSPTTIKAYKSIYNNLIKYETHTNTKLKHLDITMAFYFDFVDYCRNVLFFSENTTGNQIKYIKFFCGKIENENLPISKDYLNKEFVKPKQETNDIYLTTAEIEQIFNYDFRRTPYLDNARDLLIIGLNTGLRVSDFMRLDLNHIKDDTIRIRAKKTGKIAEIPISEQIQKTLNKNGGALPRAISEQKFNEYIKQVGKTVGLTKKTKGEKRACIDEKNGIFRKVSGTFPKYELLTSHVCRRSFATNLYGQIPTPVIMAITGHTTENQFLTYIKKTTTENAEILRNFYKKNAENKGLKPNLKIV